VPLDPLVGTLVRGQPTTPAQANDVSRRFVVGQTLKGVVLRTLPEGQTLVNFAGQHVVLALPQPLSSGHTLLATVQHITPTLVLKVLAEPGAPGVNSPQAQITPQRLGRLAETAEPLDPVQLKSSLVASQPFGEMVVALRQHLVHNPVLRGLDAGLLQRLADTLSALLPQDTTLPDASGLQTQVDRSGINYEAKVAEALTKQATPAERQALAHDLKGQLLELAARLDQASHQGHDVGASRQQVHQALRNIEWQQLSNLFAQQEHQALLLQFLHPAFPTAHTARLYFRAAPRNKGSGQEDQQTYTLVFLLDFTALGHVRIDATVRGSHIATTIRTTDEAVTHFVATHTPALITRLHDLGFQAQIACSAEQHVPMEVEDSFTRLLMADPSRLLDVTT
jgi:hypothetical protein